MADPEKTRARMDSAYRIKAAARRAKIAADVSPIENELIPFEGRIRARLNGKAMSPSASVIGPTSIDIPEFSEARKKKQD
jgi:hypothetical protein